MRFPLAALRGPLARFLLPAWLAAGAGPAHSQTPPPRPETRLEFVALVQDEAVEAALAPLLERKRAEGHPVQVLALSAILDTGRDRAESIRNHLKASFNDGKLRYLLLAGDYQHLPIRTAWICPESAQGVEYAEVQTDLYYANLTGDWDADGDGRHGEYGEDRPEFTTQLMIGRIPFSEPTAIQAVVARILDYQTDRGAWKRRTLLAAGTISVPGDSAVVTENVRLRYFVPRGWECLTFHAEGAPQGSDYVLDAETFRRALAEPAGLTYQIHHGNQDGAYTGGANNQRFLSSSDAQALASARGPVMVSLACTNGAPGGLAEQFLRWHASGFIAATQVTSPFAGTGIPAEIEAARELALGRSLGMTMRAVRDRYAAVSLRTAARRGNAVYDVVRNLYAFCLYGDPTTVANSSDAPRSQPSGARKEGAKQNLQELDREDLAAAAARARAAAEVAKEALVAQLTPEQQAALEEAKAKLEQAAAAAREHPFLAWRAFRRVRKLTNHGGPLPDGRRFGPRGEEPGRDRDRRDRGR